MIRILRILAATALVLGASPLRADDHAIDAQVTEHPDGLRTLVHTVIIDAPPERVWLAFSTPEGWKSWGVAFAEMDIRAGGAIETSYVPGAAAEDPNNIVHRILAMIPNRLMVTRIEQAPAGGPVGKDVFDRLWAVYELEPLADGRTRLTISGHGYRAGQPDDGMIAFFTEGNKQAITMMRDAVEGGSGD